MTNVVKGDQVKDSYGKIYDVIEVHEHNVMVLEPGKPYWERICMGRFDFDSYFRRADEPMTDDMPRPMGIDEEDFDEDEEEEEEFDDFEPVSRSERMDRTGGDRLERKAPKAQDSTGPIFPVENERRSNKVVNIRAATQLQVVLVKPERFENASEIADHLREKRTVVLNLESTNKEIARRLLDFLSGVAYANEGKIKKVAISTYIITPYNVDILGDLIDELENNGLYF